jgi:serine/threonine-protein kinase
MGSVYQAQHRETGARVAIKVLHPHVARDTVAVERFRREYETAKSLRHAHIIDVHGFGETDDGAHFMTMEFLEGEELSVLLEREGAMPPERAVRIVCQLALALHHAHAEGVIHRDLKPDNIIVCTSTAGEAIRVLDFGSVKLQVANGPKLTLLGTILGSPYYMSPEQATGKLDVDSRSDVFAQAAIVYELATGQVAFEGDSISEILNKAIAEQPPPVSALNPAYPWAFDEVVAKGLRKDKLERYDSSIELAEAMLRGLGLDADVERWAEAAVSEIKEAIPDAPRSSAIEPMSPLPDQSSIPPGLPTRDHRTVAVFLGIIFLGALVVGAWLVLS